MDFSVAFRALPIIMRGAQLTVILAVSVLVLGTILGFFLAVIRTRGHPVLARAASIYTWFFRGIPPLVILFGCFFALPKLGIELSPLAAAILGLTLHDGAYLGEIIRSGIESVHPGQVEAARSLGVGPLHTLRRIVLPQAARAIVPPFVTQATETVKNTALASVITVAELTQITYSIMASNYRPFEMFTLLAAIFMIINGALMALQPWVERRFALK